MPKRTELCWVGTKLCEKMCQEHLRVDELMLTVCTKFQSLTLSTGVNLRPQGSVLLLIPHPWVYGQRLWPQSKIIVTVI